MSLGGRPVAFETVEDFKKAALDYIEWVKNNPVEKTITAAFQGNISYEKVPHSRPMSQYGLAAHMGIGLTTLKDYSQKEGFSSVFKQIQAIMTAWNVDGATCGDMNGNIIARLEGLAEKQEVDLDAKIETKPMEDIFK